MANVALPLINAIAGIGSIVAGASFGAAEKAKLEQLTRDTDALRTQVDRANNLYTRTYYMVTVNLKRVADAVEKLPDDFIAQLDSRITALRTPTGTVQAIGTLAQVVGYTGAAVGTISGILRGVRKFVNNRGSVNLTDADSPWRGMPRSEFRPGGFKGFLQSRTASRLLTGLDVAGAVLAVGGLAATVGLGIWSLQKLDEAIAAVAQKRAEVTSFETGMTDVLNEVVTAAGLSPRDYEGTQRVAETWRTISQEFDHYEKLLYRAIRAYQRYASQSGAELLKSVKTRVQKNQDPQKPFPDEGYPLAKLLRDSIREQILRRPTVSDGDIVTHFATENPQEGMRFVLSEFFISIFREDVDDE